jgi:hypothetical protein
LFCPKAKLWMKTYCKLTEGCNLLKPEADGVFASIWGPDLNKHPHLEMFSMVGDWGSTRRSQYTIEPLSRPLKPFEPRQLSWFASEEVFLSADQVKWMFIDDVKARAMVVVALLPIMDIEEQHALVFAETALRDLRPTLTNKILQRDDIDTAKTCLVLLV